MNTYGIQSINNQTFNSSYYHNYEYPMGARNALVSFLKVHNLTLNILGYIPGVSTISGCVRIGSGVLMCAVTLAVGDPNGKRGAIIGPWYSEALLTGITQIGRGVLEAFIPGGWMVNASLDGIGSVINIGTQFIPQGSDLYDPGPGPHEEPEYPFPFTLLHLA